MRRRIVVLALGVALLNFGSLAAQETTGRIEGRIVDAQLLPVPGVTVTATGPQGEKIAITDTDGRFTVPLLTPGSYQLRAELQNFKTAQRNDINVSLGQTVDVGLQMEVGNISETVTVVGAAPAIDPKSTTTGGVIDSDFARTFPIGRRISDISYMAPGVSNSGSVGRQNPSISGGSGLDNQYVVDGVNITNQGYGAIRTRSLWLAQQRDTLRLLQGSPGENRRLRSRIRPIRWRRGERHHQERNERPSGLAVWVHATDRPRRHVEAIPVAEWDGANAVVRAA
jgi:hypothetical protein